MDNENEESSYPHQNFEISGRETKKLVGVALLNFACASYNNYDYDIIITMHDVLFLLALFFLNPCSVTYRVVCIHFHCWYRLVFCWHGSHSCYSCSLIHDLASFSRRESD